ncbi:hypothetical protein [Burkholderia lata]|uniref:hypothetical protein n=1 Tax=Burkholderia lata (strain ATCC 17760 / DSM 23089 / LMG 22485 / NCIMB 9086 / R18194 / 383) TaxID=482957 RepID=UPI001581F672|nr:hypothetical protein [Burkholderia lata]
MRRLPTPIHVRAIACDGLAPRLMPRTSRHPSPGQGRIQIDIHATVDSEPACSHSLLIAVSEIAGAVAASSGGRACASPTGATILTIR